jgi:predicted ATP-grasp superfamily ATP-dependent carboligase
VPHYVAAVPNPKAALALLRRLEGLVGVAVEASGLEEESESYENQVSRAVAANPEIEELVQRLESEQSERLELEEDVPSGESLARDFERYLRQQGNN